MPDLLQPLLDSNRVARLLGVEVETVGAWRRRRYGPRWFRIGKKVRYAEADVRAWMAAQASDQRSDGAFENPDFGGQP
jgi:predicted DNA-binding transcriptional regulator AlpA